MRPPIPFLAIGFAAGLLLGEVGRGGAGDGYVAVPLLAAVLIVGRRAPVGAAVAIMGVVG
jgi:hypothetical protein